MKAVVYTQNGTVEVLDRPKPTVQQPTDAVVRMLHASICGTDLHILKGDVPTAKPGLILGHEGVGIIEALGSAVQGFQRSIQSHCQQGGWTLGHQVDGTQAEFVRVPHATLSLHPLDSSVDTCAAVSLSDALPTGFECGVCNAGINPTGSVVIVGAGPVGMAALLMACLIKPAFIVMVDLDDARLETARTMGAHHTVNSAAPDAIQQLLDLTENKGYDSVIEAVGIPATFEMCQELVAVGGQIANMGVHGVKVNLHMEKLWDRNISIHMSMCNATSTRHLQNLVKKGELDISSLVTHRFPCDQAMAAYDTFKAASKHRALKVAIDF
ncbi:hypothetical protein KXV95_004124 [Aspergillus fumigatus]|nr:hypothetical protein KXX51_004064 [Aspergillus fumigatus]KAH3025599.1 hypothetical protein KXV89_008138 [Aspergillus fumigatus]KAH3492092.1 hypothetical protein KXW06_005050 [Aspergillus fumigatus]KAH3578730.1 hypothetical protein KXV95_004124 [Aspergillus fumigatus]